MKKVALIGSPRLHKNYQAALEKAGCSAVIFPDTSYVKKHPEIFDGLLLPGGGDVLTSLSDYLPFLRMPSGYSGTSGCPLCPFSGISRKNYNRSISHISPSDMELTLEQFHALDLFYKQNKPIFGICKGMQLINLYFRGTIREVGNRKLHQDPQRDVFHPADNLPGHFLHALFGPHMLINSNHHQCIDLPGQDLFMIQNASDGTAEALSHLSAPVFGTQWHPERMPDKSGQDTLLLFRYFVSLL